MWPAVVILIVLPTFFALIKAPYLTRRNRERALDGYVQEANLPLTPDVRPAVVKRIVARERSAVIGILGGGTLGFLFYILLPDSLQQQLGFGLYITSVLFALFGILIGLSTAPVVIGVSLVSRPRTGPRVARATTPTIADYVPRFERWTATAAVAAVAIVLPYGLVTVGPRARAELPPLHLSFGAIYAYVAVATYAIGKILSYRIVRTSQAAASEKELAWDDALRASTLRDLTKEPFSLAVFAVFYLTLDITLSAAGSSHGSAVLLYTILGLGLAVVLATPIVELFTQPKQHYWRRLWAEQQAAR
jgi:nitrate reductase gamma subunit